MSFSNVKYSSLPRDPPGFSYSEPSESAFEYGTSFSNNNRQYKSIFSYSSDIFEDIELEAKSENWSSYLCRLIIIFLSYIFIFITSPLSYWFVIKKLSESQRIVIYRLGKLHGSKGPGRVLVVPYLDDWRLVDIRTRAFSIPPQQAIICGGAVVEVGAEVQYHIENVVKSVSKVKDLDTSTRTLAKTAFVNILCKSNVDDIQTHKHQVHQSLQDEMNKLTSKWGLKVTRIEMSPLKVHKQPDDTAQPVISAIQGIFGGDAGPSTQNQSLPILQNLPELNSSTDHHKLSRYYLSLIQGQLHSISESEFPKLSAVYRIEVLENNHSIEIFLIIDNGSGHAVLKENLSSGILADVSIALCGKDLEDILSGLLSPLQGYIGGRIKVDGNIQMLMPFQDILSKSRCDQKIIDI